jgi:hypothetical protein
MPEEIDEQSLFDQAVSDEPVEAQAADVAEVQTETEPVRDEAGRFAKVEEEKPVLEAEKPAVDDNAPQVPSWRVREINDEKRALADRLTALETERNEWLAERQRLTASEKPVVQEKAVKPDPLLDPDGYASAVREEVRQEMLADRRETSLANAHKQYKGEFEEAYAAAQKQVDPALRARMQQSRDPGETLMEWHREQKTRAEVGNDLNAYKQKHRDELMKDPEFRKAAMEAWRNETPQTNGRPRVDLPPSLNGTSRSNSLLRPGDGDVSDAELFQQTTG